jgi:hypothetical protein
MHNKCYPTKIPATNKVCSLHFSYTPQIVLLLINFLAFLGSNLFNVY